MSAEPIKRFYQRASVDAGEGAFGVRLDHRALRTPAGAPFAAPTKTLADRVAAEWDAQGELIAPATMPVTQLAFASIDWTPKKRDELTRYVGTFGETDLCCHRADAPAQLAQRQDASWSPLVDWARETLGVSLPVVTGIVPASVEQASIESLRAQAAQLDDFRLTGLAQAAGLAGSALIAFALVMRRLNAKQAFEAASLDNLWNIEHWGADDEAQARLDRLGEEFDALGRFISALDAP